MHECQYILRCKTILHTEVWNRTQTKNLILIAAADRPYLYGLSSKMFHMYRDVAASETFLEMF